MLALLLWGCLATALTPAPADTQALPLTDLGTLGGDLSRATAINNAGQVVGFSRTASGQLHPFVWHDGVMTGLGTLGGVADSSTFLFAINAAGQVVGRSRTANGETHAFLVTPEDTDGDGKPDLWFRDLNGDGINDLMIDLRTLGGAFSQATAINEPGQVVGDAQTASGVFRPFLWQNGTMTDLGTLGGPGEFSPGFFDINADGQVVGRSLTAGGDALAFLITPEDTDGDGKPDRWFRDLNGDGRNDLMMDLDTNSSFSFARAINNGGRATGGFDTANDETHGFIWQNGVTTDLGNLGGRFTNPIAINEAGQVVGTAHTRSNDPDTTHGFIWHNRITDLGTLGGASSAALAINNSGQVVGEARTANGETHAFLIIPEDTNHDGQPDLWFRDRNGVNDLMIDLGTGVASQAIAINDAGQVVGDFVAASGFHAFLATPDRPAVLFLHGLAASFLFQGPERNLVWPALIDENLKALGSAGFGGGELDVYPTEEGIIESVSVLLPQLVVVDVYAEFVQFLNQQKAQGVISGWYAYAYDWRHDWRDIVKDGTTYSAACFERQGDSFVQNCNLCGVCLRLADKIAELAAAPGNASKKVWIVTHSNGGLLAKTLIGEPDPDRGGLPPEIGSKVAGLIMVANPQLGTPKALVALLHGGGDFAYFLATPRVLRTAVSKMPAAYQLLPTERYFERVRDPVIKFENKFSPQLEIDAWINRYNGKIDTFADMEEFLLATSGPRKDLPAAPLRIDWPAKLDSDTFRQSEDAHADIAFNFDRPTPPPFPVYQVVGVGQPTIQSLSYGSKDLRGSLLGTLNKCDGDETVVAPSAAALQTATTYFVDLRKHNELRGGNSQHSNIMNVEEIQTLIAQLMKGNEATDGFEFIGRSKPVTSCKDRFVRTLSPAEIHLFQGGLHTGPVKTADVEGEFPLIEEEIPNSQYRILGEGREAFVDERGTYQALIEATGTGTVTLEGGRLQGDLTDVVFRIPDIPVRLGSRIRFELDPAAGSPPQMTMDVEGDGTPEFVISIGAPPGPEVFLAVIRSAVDQLGTDTAAADLPRSTAEVLREKFLEKAVEALEAAKEDLLRKPERVVEGLERVKKALQGYTGLLERQVADGRVREAVVAPLRDAAAGIVSLLGTARERLPLPPLHAETQKGASSSSLRVETSSSLAAVAGDLYLAAISTKPNVEVASVEGLGLTWTPVKEQCSGRAQTRVELWLGSGTPTASGRVKATLKGEPETAVIAASRYTRASGIGNVASANSLGPDGGCIGGTDSKRYSAVLPVGAPNPVAYVAIAERHKTNTPGSGFTERIEVHAGGREGDRAGLAVEDKALADLSAVEVSGTLSGNTDWAAVAVEVLPKASP